MDARSTSTATCGATLATYTVTTLATYTATFTRTRCLTGRNLYLWRTNRALPDRPQCVAFGVCWTIVIACFIAVCKIHETSRNFCTKLCCTIETAIFSCSSIPWPLVLSRTQLRASSLDLNQVARSLLPMDVFPPADTGYHGRRYTSPVASERVEIFRIKPAIT